MKKIIIVLLAIFSMLPTKADTTDMMVIEKADGTKMELNVLDIERVIFESVYANPEGSVANAVDMGLSVKWASWNLGATSYLDNGGYYGWADPTGKLTSNDISLYPSATPPQTISGTEYDIAKAKWGGNWRLPTYEEIKELVANCTWSTYDENGRTYIRAQANNGNSIIFPVAGLRIENEIADIDKVGWYWTGTLLEEDNTYAYIFEIDMKESTVGPTAVMRSAGLSIRPVLDERIKITIKTEAATGITHNSVKLNASFIADSPLDEDGFGFRLKNGNNPYTSYEDVNVSGTSFSITISDLNPNTKYSYTAYYRSNGETIYGEELSFTTSAPPVPTTGSLNGHDWVDLGLPSGLKWATCNVGASTPEGYGNHYAWGCTSTQYRYDSWNSYPYFDVSSGTILNIGSNISGNSSYDAARKNWKSSWRLPTLSEAEELVKYCTATCTYLNGVPVTKVTGPNGNSIYFPYPGVYSDTIDGKDEYGCYWLGSGADYYTAPRLYFQKDSSKFNFTINQHETNLKMRGYTIRAVTE